MQLSRLAGASLLVVAAAMGAYHLICTFYLLQEPLLAQNSHLGFALLVVFLLALKSKPKQWPMWLALLAASLAAAIYVQILYAELAYRQMIVITVPDVVIGLVFMVVVIAAIGQVWGHALPAVIAFLILYAFLGYLVPEPIKGVWYPFDRIVAKLGIGLMGMYGPVLSASVKYIFPFMIFGGLLGAAGGNLFFYEVGKGAGRLFKGGPALTAVVGSTLVGMSSGSTSANVIITGTFTIPLMKKIGYTPVEAASIEAAASNGGQATPPVLGAVGFVMASFLGVPYTMVMFAAIIPAFLYYLGLALYVQFVAMKRNIQPVLEPVNTRVLLGTAHLFFVPLGVITAFLLAGFSPSYAAFYGVVCVTALMLVKKETRSVRRWFVGFTEGVFNGARIGVACAGIGFIVASVQISGMGIKFPALVEMLSGGLLIPAMIITMLVSLILGGGLPTSAAYIIVSLVTTPVFVKMGLTPFQVHFMALYFGCYALLSPPVGTTSLVAARLAGANYMKTTVEAMKVGAGGLVVPFLFIFCPGLLWQHQSLPLTATGLAASMVIVVALSAILAKYYLTKLNLLDRALLVMTVVVTYSYLVTQALLLLAIGVTLLVLTTLWQLRQRRLFESMYWKATDK